MAYKQTPGRSNMPKTGRGIPPTLMYRSPMHQTIDPITGLKKAAEAEALKKQAEAGPNTGGSSTTRTFEGSASATIPGKKVEKLASTPEEIAKWKAAKARAEQEGKPFGEQYKSKTITETATVSDTGVDKPQLTTKPNPVTGTPSRKIYVIEGTRGYTGSNATGTRGLTTLNEGRANSEIKFTNRMNALNDENYAQAEEGSGAARGLTGKALERRNAEVERRRLALHRKDPTIKVIEVDAKSAKTTANAMNKAHWDSNIDKNKAEGIDRVVFQKRSENKKAMAKKATAKKSPAKQMKSKAKTPAKMKKC